MMLTNAVGVVLIGPVRHVQGLPNKAGAVSWKRKNIENIEPEPDHTRHRKQRHHEYLLRNPSKKIYLRRFFLQRFPCRLRLHLRAGKESNPIVHHQHIYPNFTILILNYFL